MGVLKKLLAIQSELKAPKSQFNNFGKYNYRSAEDILEALKPLLTKHKAILVITDSLELAGDRVFIKATAKFFDTETGSSIEASALAREAVERKGMDDSQITGATSSYARKYALNGLFAIDDTKDADVTNTHQKPFLIPTPKNATETISEPQQKRLFALAQGNPEIVKIAIGERGHKQTNEVKKTEYQVVCDRIEELLEEVRVG